MKYVFHILLVSISFSQTYIGEGLTGNELLEFVQENYTPSETMGYNTARDTMYAVIDLKENNQLSCVYTGYTITIDMEVDPSTNAYEQGINCEHSYPQSMGAGDEPQKSDMHHLFPCKSNVNSSRGNDPYAEIPDENTEKWYRNDYYQYNIPTEFIEEYAEKYNPSNSDDERFEPREDHKGNTARAMFYFYAIYNDVADAEFWELQKDDLLDWHYYDAVDEIEENRTWIIASYQDNKPNPFVLDNSLALRIWFEELIVYGCIDSTASNYNPDANVSNGECEYLGIEIHPESFTIANPYPNPFNPSTTIEFVAKEREKLKISIINVQGIEVEIINEGYYLPGIYTINWKPNDIVSGIYFIRFDNGYKTTIKKVLLVK